MIVYKWTLRDGHLVAVRITIDDDSPQPVLDVLTVDGWQPAEHPFPLSDPARPGYHPAASDEGAASAQLLAAGVDLSAATQR